MAHIVIYTILSVILVSSVSLIGALTLALKKKAGNKTLLFLVSLSAGTLLGGAFLHLLPEAVEEEGLTGTVSLLVIAGVLLFFLIEKFIHLHGCHLPQAHKHHEPHPHHIGIINLFGDGLHNFADGLIIAASYLASVPLGLATTIAVVLHEVPQEMADFGVLLYSGFTKKRALFLNFLSATVALLGAMVGLIWGNLSEAFLGIILPLAAGGFVYIAGSNLIPELHKECRLKDSLWHFAALLLGVGLMVSLKVWG